MSAFECFLELFRKSEDPVYRAYCNGRNDAIRDIRTNLPLLVRDAASELKKARVSMSEINPVTRSISIHIHLREERKP